MASRTEALQVDLQNEPFCIPTGPHDGGIVYPCDVKVAPFQPVLLDSPVVFHLYLPDLFPGEVLKIHAEHLGHFLTLQSLPKVTSEIEDALFRGLCRLFTRERVLAVYNDVLTADDPEHDLPCGQRLEDYEDDAACESRCVFVTFDSKNDPRCPLALLRGLLALFNTADLLEDISPTPDCEPDHMLFLYLVQLMALFVSSILNEKTLAVIMSVASSVFLESNLCHPLCAATILKPMFVPYYKKQTGRSKKKTDSKQLTEYEPKVACYKLFTGYELNDKGEDVSTSGDIEWTERGILDCIQGWKLEEKNTRKLWFVAPQMGDRLKLAGPEALQFMGRQTGEKAVKVAELLLCDNVMGYVQSSVFGTLHNMLPCDANSEFDEPVMAAMQFSMSRLSESVWRQSRNLLSLMRTITNSSLYVSGVGFAGQDGGGSLYFGRVFTGSEEKRPQATGTFGTFTSVIFGTLRETMMSDMLLSAYGLRSPTDKSVHARLTVPYKHSPHCACTMSDVQLYGRFHHRLNSGEFTEIAGVKPMSECTNKNIPSEDTLTVNSKYRLTAVHGALPMCGLTMALTLRQTTMMVMGFLCAEMARCIYGTKTVDLMSVCKSITSLSMCCKFKQPKTDEQAKINTLKTPFGDLLKLSRMVFGSPSNRRRDDLDNMEWLDVNDCRLPDYVRTSLSILGDTRRLVEQIMMEKKKSYNRVVFSTNNRRMSMVQLYENEKGMVQAPIMATSTMRVFTNSSKSYAACKFAAGGSYYLVKVFSNSCIKTRLYHRDESSELQALMRPNQSTVDDVIETVEKEVSVALPRIDINRLRMIAGDLNVTDFEALMVAVRRKNIQVIGYVPASSSKPDTKPPPHAQQTREEFEQKGISKFSAKRKDRSDEYGVEYSAGARKTLKGTHASMDDACVPSTSKAGAVNRSTYDFTGATTELSVVDDIDVDFGFDDD